MISTAKQYPVTRLPDEDKGGPMPGWMRNRQKMRGFTLIEVIVSLILVGILAAVGGMAIVQAVQGYMFVKDNAAMTQKAQLAMSRITREIVEMTGITANATATVLPVSNVDRNVTLGLDSGAIKIAPDGTQLSDGDTLVDHVNAFSLTYYSKDSSGNDVIATSWSTTKEISLLAAIDVNLQLARPSGGYMNFANRVSPRTNKNQGGAPPNVPPPTIPNYGCFVATAAFGDAAHPAVVLLRDFRDRFLLTWGGGRWLANQYYIYGPTAAGLIQDRPVAVWAVRGLLLPIAAVTFIILYAPWAIPFLILCSAILTGALFSAGRKRRKSMRLSLPRQKGSILVGLIATMVIMAALGAAMLPMFSSSTMNQVYSDHGRKAYFLAESGFRYAASEFLNAPTLAAKQTVLTNINNKTCNLLSSGGSFTLVVYPFWTVSQTQSGTTLTTQISGTVPAQLNTGTGGYLRVENSSSFYSYTSRTGSGTTVTFSGLSGTVSAAKEIFTVALPSGNGTQTVTECGNLTLNGTGADAFPQVNGNFTLYPTPDELTGGLVFNYEKKVGNTLQNITLIDPTKTWTNFTVKGGAHDDVQTTKITLDKFLRLSSTGHYGQATRPILYNVPIGWMAGGGEFAKKQFQDPFNSQDKWTTGDQAMGTQSVSGGAMNVTETVNPTGVGGILQGLLGWSGNGNWAFTSFNWGSTETNLAQAWMDSEGCLSYDMQVKVNTTNLENPNNFFMGGLGFRMRNNTNSSDLHLYGVSVVRGRQISVAGGSWRNDWIGLGDEGIANELANLLFVGTMEEISGGFLTQYRYSQPAIVLWQRTGPATSVGSFKVLAYRLLTAADAIVTGTAPALRLKPWSSLMVRLTEGYELPFTQGRVDASGRHLKYGDFIRNSDGSKTARVIGTPVMSAAWGGNNTTTGAGTLMLTNVKRDGSGNLLQFTSGENIYLQGGDGTAYAQASASMATTKTNYIMVYFSDDKTPVAGNTVQADNTRIGNARNGAYFLSGSVWPPDDWTDRKAGLPTDNPPGNDWFTLVQWHYAVPTLPLPIDVSSPANGWNYSGGNLSRVAAYGTPITPPLTLGWTRGTGWTYGSNYLQKNSNPTSTTSATYPVSTTASTNYDVWMTIYRTSGSFFGSGGASYTFGGVSGGSITGTQNTSVSYGPTTFTATGSTTNFIITGEGHLFAGWQGRLTALSVSPHTTAADQPVTHNALAIGDTYNISVNVSSITSGSFYYTISGCTSPTISSSGTHTMTCTALNTNPLTFYSPDAGNRFTISSISITPPGTYVPTLDTTAASYVTAASGTDFYHAVIRTGTLVTGAWTSSSTASNFTGDSIALITSGNSVTSEHPFQYDDFGIQLDLKSGTGFLPPIQQ